MPITERCPCGKEKDFAHCCGRFLDGGEVAKTAEQVMRSRYTAYALGGHGDYLLRTWFPATAQGLTAEQLSQRELNWQKLEVLTKSQNGDEATVEFKAYYLPKNADQLAVMHEHSEFQRINGRWYYVGGRVI
jgi:SEC-C motif-containing protein